MFTIIRGTAEIKHIIIVTGKHQYIFFNFKETKCMNDLGLKMCMHVHKHAAPLVHTRRKTHSLPHFKIHGFNHKFQLLHKDVLNALAVHNTD